MQIILHVATLSLASIPDEELPPLAQEIDGPTYENYTAAMDNCVWYQPAVYDAASTIHLFSYKLNKDFLGGTELSQMPLSQYIPTSGMYSACDVIGGSFCYGVVKRSKSVGGTLCVLPECKEADLNNILKGVLLPLIAKNELKDPANIVSRLTSFKCHREDPKFKDDNDAIGVVSFIATIGFISIVCTVVCRCVEMNDMLKDAVREAKEKETPNEPEEIDMSTKLLNPVAKRSTETRKKSEQPEKRCFFLKLCDCWDLKLAVKELFATSSRPTNFLNMMRVVSSVWIIYQHIPDLPVENATENEHDMYDYMKSFNGYFYTGGLYAVDTFFFMSAFLVALLGVKTWPRTDPVLQQAKRVAMCYLDRYVRITPVYGLCILAAYHVFMYISSGPFARLAANGGSLAEPCGDRWWRNLLFINNFKADDPLCFGHCWYLACDFQLMVFGVLIVAGYAHKPRYTVLVSSFLIVASLSVCYARTRGSGDQYTGGFNRSYVKPWIRAPPYLFGLLSAFAYTSDANENIKIVLKNHSVRWGGYLVVGSTMIGCCFIPWAAYRDRVNGDTWSKDQIAWSQVAYHFLWGAALSILTLTFVNGHGGWVRDMMAHGVWEPLGKLTFSVYLIHPMIIGIAKLSYGPNLVHFNGWWFTFITTGVAVGSYVAAGLLFVFVERPVAATWSLLSGRSKRRAVKK
eukprot:TRINITY_DN124_c1_g2_i1.p1 TRINITY_DN124_c1_g2~~TRINITY_DN124_c1_g2_i1.p1  ORF type:complete len:700 (+),score=86.42 TRINITY_DN124_c1_g2_i1:44-2101(+)